MKDREGITEKVKSLANNFSLAKLACDHLLGDHKPHWYKLLIGVIIIVSGVLLSKLGTGFVHILCDGTGYLLHGIGALPIIQRIEKIKYG